MAQRVFRFLKRRAAKVHNEQSGVSILGLRRCSYAVLFIFVSTFGGLTAVNEPMCTSRFDFEEKLLKKLVRMEHAMELLQEHVSNELSAMRKEKVKMGEDFLTFKDGFISEQSVVKDNFGKLNEEIELEKLKLADEFKTISQQYESKIQRMSGVFTEALNKTLKRERIAFAAQTATGNLVNGVPTFAESYVNVGNAYDMSTGKFTCSEDGVYSFTFIVRSKTSSYVYCYIRLNKERKKYSITEGINNMSSVTIYLSLTTGDVVDIGDCVNWEASKVNIHGTLFLGMEIN